MIGFVLWALAFGALMVLEGLSLTMRGHQWPSLSDMLRAATRPVWGRWLLLAFWVWLGWHLFIRGWSFFLAGHGAKEPPKGLGGNKTLGETVKQVVGPLVVVYAAMLGMLVAGWRARRKTQEAPSTRAATFSVRPEWRAFATYAVVTIVASYAIFVAAMGVYQLAIGHSAAGIARSALVGGAFMAFVIGLPALVAVTIVWGLVLRRRDASHRPRQHV